MVATLRGFVFSLAGREVFCGVKGRGEDGREWLQQNTGYHPRNTPTAESEMRPRNLHF